MLKKLTMASALMFGAALSALPAMAQEYPKKQPIKLDPALKGGTEPTIPKGNSQILHAKRLPTGDYVERDGYEMYEPHTYYHLR